MSAGGGGAQHVRRMQRRMPRQRGRLRRRDSRQLLARRVRPGRQTAGTAPPWHLTRPLAPQTGPGSTPGSAKPMTCDPLRTRSPSARPGDIADLQRTSNFEYAERSERRPTRGSQFGYERRRMAARKQRLHRHAGRSESGQPPSGTLGTPANTGAQFGANGVNGGVNNGTAATPVNPNQASSAAARSEPPRTPAANSEPRRVPTESTMRQSSPTVPRRRGGALSAPERASRGRIIRTWRPTSARERR